MKRKFKKKVIVKRVLRKNISKAKTKVISKIKRKASKDITRSNTLSIIPYEVLINKIFFIREEKVMLDKDLAALYGVKPIRLREQVKRNIKKFPSNFMFRLSKHEVENLVSQNAIPSHSHLGGTNPFAFTEHGILMLSTILKSKCATEVSIRLIEVFVRLRSMMITNAELKLEIEHIKNSIKNNDHNIQMIFGFLDDLLAKKEKRTAIGFKIRS